MTHAGRDPVVAELRARLDRLASSRRRSGVLPFGVAQIDRRLPGGGLCLGALHEVAQAGPAHAYGALATLFIAGVAARLKGPVLWCLSSRDLFAPGLAAAGLHPDRVIYAETGKDADVLPVMEEGLRHRGLAAVVGEVARTGLKSTRRLHLAAEKSGCTALLLQRWGEAAANRGSAAVTRWRIAPQPSREHPVPGLGRARWRLELVRVRGGEPASWIVEACDEKGRLAFSPDMADGPHPQTH
ncbi:MAG TPA: damage-inducible mutagenesis protein [Beijerinckiaceae bacterium]|nr:damage-inducible mutagenesis protein [Beijerinckiaceae bacterium]